MYIKYNCFCAVFVESSSWWSTFCFPFEKKINSLISNPRAFIGYFWMLGQSSHISLSDSLPVCPRRSAPYPINSFSVASTFTVAQFPNSFCSFTPACVRLTFSHFFPLQSFRHVPNFQALPRIFHSEAVSTIPFSPYLPHSLFQFLLLFHIRSSHRFCSLLTL